MLHPISFRCGASIGLTSSSPSALCGNVRPARLGGRGEANRFGPLLARGKQCIRRNWLHNRRYALAENSYTKNITDTTADTTSSVTQGTCILQSSNIHPAIDKRETRVDVQSGMVL